MGVLGAFDGVTERITIYDIEPGMIYSQHLRGLHVFSEARHVLIRLRQLFHEAPVERRRQLAGIWRGSEFYL